MDIDDLYANPYWDKHTGTLSTCIDEEIEISEHTSKESQSHISYGYITSSLITSDWFNELLMLMIGALASALIIGLIRSLVIEIAKFNNIIVVILGILILIRVIRR